VPCGLLLRRAATSGNPLTLGLPGGNADPEDLGDLMVTACRESREEMGDVLPEFRQVACILTKRGKREQKHYTVFIVKAVDDDVQRNWTPKLNEEHTEFHWMPIKDIMERDDLHPVVSQLVEEPFREMLFRAAGMSD